MAGHAIVAGASPGEALHDEGTSRVCNLYRLTSNVEAMRRLFAVDPSSSPNLPLFERDLPGSGRARDHYRSTSGGTPRVHGDASGASRRQWPASRPVTNVRNLVSPFWRTALSRPDRRCLVPVTAFSEWTAEPDPGDGAQAQGVVRRAGAGGVRVRRRVAAD